MTLEAKKIMINGTLWANNIVKDTTTLSSPTTADTTWYNYDAVYITSTGTLRLPDATKFTGSREINITLAYGSTLTIEGSYVSGQFFNCVHLRASTGASGVIPYNGSFTGVTYYASVKWIYGNQWQIVWE